MKRAPSPSESTRFASGGASGGDIAGLGAPRWDLTPIYPSFESKEYLDSRAALERAIADFLRVVQDKAAREGNAETWLRTCIELYNTTADLAENLEAYAYTQYSVNTQDKAAVAELNALEELTLPLQRAIVIFRNELAGLRDEIPSIVDRNGEIAPYRFFLEEQLAFQKKQMTPAEEDLAADLSRPGAEAWSRLQETISSTLTATWDDSSGEKKTVVELRGLAYHADRSIRKRAYELELSAWKQMEIPLAAALNGVKGFSSILNGRRSYESTLERSVMQSRITPKILSSMIGVMEESLPVFRRYLRAKARLLGVPKIAFFDIFGPVGNAARTWTFADAREFIVDQFTGFSPELGAFATKAFDGQWIDAESRNGKAGGAYCQSFPLAHTSRIMANFDGSFPAVSTIAHELGHGYHHEVLKDATAIHRSYPMTLAETASIFCETIVFNGALSACGDAERITILETLLQEITQVIVDILSRFYFERNVFARRSEREMAPDEFCDMMLKAQKDTYGDAMDENSLHPYMWAVKSHYYRANLAFYNFPYAFGQLFGLGLYRLYGNEPDGFSDRYRRLLELTGKASARDVTREVGFDIESSGFWREGMKFVEEKVAEFETLVGKMA